LGFFLVVMGVVVVGVVVVANVLFAMPNFCFGGVGGIGGIFIVVKDHADSCYPAEISTYSSIEVKSVRFAWIYGFICSSRVCCMVTMME